MKFYVLALLSLSSLAILSVSPFASAKGPFEKPYQVEVIIFERQSDTIGYDKEVWRPNIKLEYPSEIIELITSEEKLQDLDVADNADILPKHSNIQQEISQEQPSFEFLTKLPKETYRLEEQSQALRVRRNNLRILFHEAWIQDITAPENTTALAIQGGSKFGDHYELEGTLHISVKRYLHVNTNLWLTSFRTDDGFDLMDWPQLPKKPVALNKPIKDEITFLADSIDEEEAFIINLEDIENSYAGNSISEIVLLQQKRKMRSKTLHYIDHPKIGLLIRIDVAESNKES